MSKQSLPPIERPMKKRILGISFSRRQLIIFLLVFGAIGGAVLYKTLVTRGANFSWLQTSWSGGASTTARASHTNNQTGWTQYESKDTLLSTSTEGELTLTASTSSNIDTTFSPASSTSNTYIENGTVKLKKPNGVACATNNECSTEKCLGVCGNCSGTAYDGKCLYLSSAGSSCSTACSSHGGSSGAYSDNLNCDGLKLFTSCSSCTGGSWSGHPSVQSGACSYNTNISGWSPDTTWGGVPRLCACNS